MFFISYTKYIFQIYIKIKNFDLNLKFFFWIIVKFIIDYQKKNISY